MSREDTPIFPYRLRQSPFPFCLSPGATHAAMTMARTEGLVSLYKGLVPTLIGIAPYAALNFASYDLIKKWIYHGEK